jgi:outer membrane protein TolC
VELAFPRRRGPAESGASKKTNKAEGDVMSRIATCCVFACLVPAIAAGQPASRPAGERLSLETAIRQAVENNRQLQTALLQVRKAEEDVAAARTHRLPSFETTVFASELLTPVKFAFPAGAFGDYPGIGPIPSADATVTSDRKPTLFVSGQVLQPLSQLGRIGLGIRGAEAARDLERERAREQQLEVINSVKRIYFAILQTESALTASDEAIALYKELDRTLQHRVTQKVALRSDALDVQFRLAQEELTRVTRKNTLASQKEQLNQLLGRDVRMGFELEGVAAMSLLDADLGAAQARALANRPDVRQARLAVERAVVDRRMKKTEWIRDISLAVSYTSNFNMDVLPTNLAAIGVQLKWEPFDWGRKGHELAAKAHTVEQARHGIRDAEDRAVLELNALFRKLTEARALLSVVEMSQNTVREKLRVTTNQFQLQAALLSDVLHVRAELADSDDRYQQALLAFWTAKADFDHAVGEEVIQ